MTMIAKKMKWNNRFTWNWRRSFLEMAVIYQVEIEHI